MMNNALERLKGQLIVSCQAFPGWPLYSPEYMARMAAAAEEGGAGGVRACWPDFIRQVRAATTLPIVGINKVTGDHEPTLDEVIITPTFESAAAVIEAGCDVLGMDCTPRGRTYDDVARIIEQIRKHYPGIPIMADISTLEEGMKAAEMGVDIVSSTLSGFTPASLKLSAQELKRLEETDDRPVLPPDFALVKALRQNTKAMVNAEGRYWEVAQIQEGFRSGADMMTIGSAITAPQLIVKRFVKAIQSL